MMESEQFNQTPPIQTPTEQKAVQPIPLIAGIVVLILLIAAGIYFFTNIGKNPQVLLENKKVDLLERVSEADKTPLTNEEKMSILEKYGGAQTSKYNFTDEEKEKILKALNGE